MSSSFGSRDDVAREEVSGGVATLPRGKVFYISIVCFLAWVFSVFDYVLFGTLLPRIADEFGWSAATSTAIATYVTLGTFFVCFVVGPMLDYLGRKLSLILCTVGVALTSGFTALATGAVYIVIVRAFSALGYSEEVVNTVYLNEVYGKNRRRGFMYSFVQSGWPVGALLAAAFSALMLPIVGWRGTFLFAAFPALVIVLLGLKLRESPVFEAVKRVRRLKREGRHEEAEEYGRQSGLSTEHSEESNWRQIFEPDLRQHTVLLSLAWLFNWMGIQVFSVLGTTVLVEAKDFSFSNSLTVLIVANVAGFLGYLTHGFVGDLLGRRNTIIGGWLIGGTVMTAMLFGPSLAVFVIITYSVGLFFLNGPYAALLFYMGESFPARVRGIGPNFAHTFGPLGAIAGSAALTGVLAIGVDMAVAAFVAGALGMFLSGLCLLGCRKINQGQTETATGAG